MRIALNAGQAIRLHEAQRRLTLAAQQAHRAQVDVRAVLAGIVPEEKIDAEWTVEIDGDEVRLVEVEHVAPEPAHE